MAKRVLLLASTTGYQTRRFEDAARSLDLEVQMATDRCHHLEDPWGDKAIALRFENPKEAVEVLLSSQPRPDAVVAVGDRPTAIAAAVADGLGLPYHPIVAVEACRDKFLARERFAEAGLLVPSYYRVPFSASPNDAAFVAPYPCVLKPLGLSASRGVIRANHPSEFSEAFGRILNILNGPDIRRLRQPQDDFIQVESFIPGSEFALEGLVTDGNLQTLAIFDKPDPLDGPYFEETIYTTPSRAPWEVQDAIRQTAQRAVNALNLTYGPVHAEMRYNDSGVWMLEVAARPIGGLCAQALRFNGSASLEEVILRHALGEDVSGLSREQSASGVMMIPIPSNGIYVGVSGADENTIITAKAGQTLRRLPEGNSYLGFIFAKAMSADEVERALRLSHSKLHFEIATELATLRPSP